MESRSVLNERKAKAEELLSRVELLQSIKGQAKLMRKINAEKYFLSTLEKKYSTNKDLKIENHLKSSNLNHLEALVLAAEHARDVCSILKKVTYEKNNLMREIVVDIESGHGKHWFKVFARNPFAIHKVWEGLGQFGDKDVCIVAADYQEAARQNLVDFIEPSVVFLFASGITTSVADALTKMGVKIIGQIIPDLFDDAVEERSVKGISTAIEGIASLIRNFELSSKESCIDKVNLDITALIALVSALTNGNCEYNFKDQVLQQQADEEKTAPVLPILKSFLSNKELYVCETAYSDFNDILKTIGGEQEIKRAKELLAQLIVFPDCPSERAMLLTDSASIKMRSKIIFGSGDTLKAKTVTANKSFVRAAHDQGVDFSVFYHASRALTERKQTR